MHLGRFRNRLYGRVAISGAGKTLTAVDVVPGAHPALGHTQLSHWPVVGSSTKHWGQVEGVCRMGGRAGLGPRAAPWGGVETPAFGDLPSRLRAASARLRFFAIGLPCGTVLPSGGRLSRASSRRTTFTRSSSAMQALQRTPRGRPTGLPQMRHGLGPWSGPMSRMSRPGAVAFSDAPRFRSRTWPGDMPPLCRRTFERLPQELMRSERVVHVARIHQGREELEPRGVLRRA